jgi:hypothetical protein
LWKILLVATRAMCICSPLLHPSLF